MSGAPQPGRRAALVAIGDELLAGAHPDLNSPALAAGLSQVGWPVARAAVMGDDEVAIACTMADLCSEHGLVVASGGLGPTLDDVTRHAAARAAGRELVTSPEALEQVHRWYETSGRTMPASNERQALIPEGATVLPNPIGTAPGFRVRVGESWLVVLPGPPRELQAMLESALLPWLESEGSDGLLRETRRFHLVGLSESVFADEAGDWMDRGQNPLMGVTVARGVMSVRLVGRASDRGELTDLLDRRAAAFRERFQRWIFSEEQADPAQVLGRRLVEEGITVSCAESCTGGLVAGSLTRYPGISEVFERGFVTYSNQAKSELLGVPEELVEEHGAVSGQVARAMALGAAERSGAQLAVSTTGIAGPGGGSDEKPVGLVWFGVALGGRAWSEERRWPGSAGRAKIRQWATLHAIGLCLRALDGSLELDRGR